MRPLRSSLRWLMLAILVSGVLLWLVVEHPESLLVLVLLIPLFLVYMVSRLPYRFRLPIEIATALLLLTLTAWLRSPQFYASRAARADELARLATVWADHANTQQSRERLQREAAWFRRRAWRLYRHALWLGLFYPDESRWVDPLDQEEMLRQLGLMRAMEIHEESIRQEHKRSCADCYRALPTRGPSFMDG